MCEYAVRESLSRSLNEPIRCAKSAPANVAIATSTSMKKQEVSRHNTGLKSEPAKYRPFVAQHRKIVGCKLCLAQRQNLYNLWYSKPRLRCRRAGGFSCEWTKLLC